ncbi:MAG: hypothetical protein HKP18_12080 [Acidimicrobiia bacterium]|nr:hypothetical protein [Acidimicrobiia bacterium]
MRRTNIAGTIAAERVLVELDEVYEAGSTVTASSHFVDEFVANASGVTHRLVISGITAPGLLGFFYRKFGSSKTGNAFLAAYRAYLETAPD